MASKENWKSNLLLQGDEQENDHSPNHRIQHNLTFLDGDDETYWENKDEKHDLSQGAINQEPEYCVEVDNKTEGSTPQPGLRQDPTSREELYKRCQWFDGFDEPVGPNAALSPPQRNHSKLSPKQVYRRMKSRRQVSPTAICSLKAEECEFEFSPARSQNLVGVCLPPGCIPSNMIVQVTREESQSGKETRAIMEIDGELDLWVRDICSQALRMVNVDEPWIMTTPVEPGASIVHDLHDQNWPELDGRTMLIGFLRSRKAAQRRNAICEELEMVTGLVKINGAKFSLWHLRKELPNTLRKEEIPEKNP